MGRRRRRPGPTSRPSGYSESNFSNSRESSDAAPGRDFERRVAKRLEELGWDVSLIPGSGDGGVDVICRCGSAVLVVQCKDWANPVGYSAVQEVHAARDLLSASLAAVISANSFTKPARDRALRLKVLLLTIRDLQPGCHIDRTKEGDEIRARRRARAEEEAAEQARQRAVWEAAAQRKVEEALAKEWQSYDLAFAEYKRRLAVRGHKLTYIGLGGLVGGFGLIWLGQSRPWLASTLAFVTAVIGWDYVTTLFKQQPPSPPAQTRVGASKEPPGISPASDATFGAEKRVASCIHCGELLRLPAGKKGSVKCPSCSKSAWYET
jgi:hypothetical protein